MTLADQPPPPAVRDAAAIKQFWKVYQANLELIARNTQGIARDHPEVTALLPANVDELRATLQSAVEAGDWNGFRRLMQELGVFYANAGVSFHVWSEAVQGFKLAVLPLLVEEARGDEHRLTTLVRGAEAYSQTALAAIGEGYIDTKEQRIIETRNAMVQRFEQLLDGVPIGVGLLDRTGHLEYANKTARAVLATPARGESTNGIRARIRIYRTGTDEPFPLEELPSAVALHGSPAHRDDLEMQLADGQRVALECWATPLLDDGGHTELVAYAFVDITERLRMQSQLVALNATLDQRVQDRTAELESANRELDAFTYSVSHDLRAPLRAMNGFSQLLLTRYGGSLVPEAQDYLQRIAANAARMGQLIDELLAFSRLGRQTISRSTVKPSAIARDALQELGEAASIQDADIAIDDMPHVRADALLLKQVYVNLLSNALKYASPDRRCTIRVGCSEEGGEPVFHVRDNGIGFDMKYVDKLFRVFQRLHTNGQVEGVGVGLAIVDRIIRRHGGRIFAVGAVDEGATFAFTLSPP